MEDIAGIKLQMDMQDVSCGNFYDLKSDNIDRTAFLFVLKDKQNFWQDYRKIEYEGYEIIIRNFIVKNEQEDPFSGYINSVNIGVNIAGIDTLPLYHFTDHKKEYPIFFTEIIVYGLIKFWDLKYEKPDEILGPPHNKDKIFALSAWNKAIRNNEIFKKLRYEDVSFLGQFYFEKSSDKPKYSRCLALTTKTAYRDGVVNYLFKNDLYDFLINRNDNLKKEINTIEELKSIVYDVFIDVFKHHIEDRRWIEAFWDGKKKVNVEDKKLEIPMEPKNEININPHCM